MRVQIKNTQSAKLSILMLKDLQMFKCRNKHPKSKKIKLKKLKQVFFKSSISVTQSTSCHKKRIHRTLVRKKNLMKTKNYKFLMKILTKLRSCVLTLHDTRKVNTSPNSLIQNKTIYQFLDGVLMGKIWRKFLSIRKTIINHAVYLANLTLQQLIMLIKSMSWKNTEGSKAMMMLDININKKETQVNNGMTIPSFYHQVKSKWFKLEIRFKTSNLSDIWLLYSISDWKMVTWKKKFKRMLDNQTNN